MTDYERGSAAWDIGMILTRHNHSCARCDSLRHTAAQKSLHGTERLTLALATTCDCGAGDSKSEQTSLGKTKELA